MSQPLDEIPLTRTVLFSAEFFTMMSTVVLDEKFREPGESDDNFAIRLASLWIRQYYDFDVAGASIAIGVLEE